ncbi:MAG: hypothetical protein LC734_06625, partial [Acidobacteria bacterium]|nr:hypothetical protein [Acidobacteriota bacterium]
VSYLERAAETAVEIEHDEERIRAFVEIGNQFTHAKRNDRAIETFDKAKRYAEVLDNIHRDNFLAAVAAGFARAGSIDLADRALDLVTDKTQIASAMLAYSQTFWQKGERDEALEALEEALQVLRSQREIETRSNRAKQTLFATIAAQFAGFEKSERAIEIASEIEDDEQKTAALTRVAEILTFRNEDAHARQAFTAIGEDSARALALIKMSDAKEESGAREIARTLLDESFHLAETVPQMASRSSAYNEIARRFAGWGEKEKAEEVARMNLQTVAAIRDESSRVAALADIAELVETENFQLNDENKSTIATILGLGR